MIVEDAIELKKEFSIKVVDTVDIKDEIPEAVTFTPVKTEQKVRLWCVCGCGSSCFQAIYCLKSRASHCAVTHPLFNSTF